MRSDARQFLYSMIQSWPVPSRTAEMQDIFQVKHICFVYRWDGRRCRLYFRIIAGSYNDEKLISFPAQLETQLRGEKVILVWDGLPSHRSCQMSQYLNQQQRWLSVVGLPAYAPEMNPIESLWSNILGQELANRSVSELGEMVKGVRSGFRRVHSEEWLLRSC